MNRWVQGHIRQRQFGELTIETHGPVTPSSMSSHTPSLRQQLRHKRRSLNRGQQHTAASALAHRLTSDLSVVCAERIAFYQPADGEIDPTIFLNWCHKAGKKIYLPVIPEGLVPNQVALLFQAFIPGETQLVSNRFGNLEPAFNKQQCINVALLNLVLMPLVGFDRIGNRLGMGKGYYDRTFKTKVQAFRKPRLIGLAHSVQEAVLTPNSWDVPLDAVFTDKEKISY